jgi:8-oxo-dGTP diphosphatase
MQAHALVVFNKKILLMLRDNIPTIAYPNCWSLIGGKAFEGETPEQTLLRQFCEETNVIPQKFQYIMKWPGSETHLYFVPLSEQEALRIRLGNEGQALRFFTINQIEELRLSGTFGREFYRNKYLLQDLLETT